MAKSSSPPISNFETGGGDTIIYRPGTTTSSQPPITNVKANTNLTITYSTN